MNNNLDWLCQELLASFDQQSKSEQSSLKQGRDFVLPSWDSSAQDGESNLDDSCNWEDEAWDVASSNGGESALTPQPFSLGDLPTVQKRFQTLLKQRLYSEMQRNPPRFPWEHDGENYRVDYSDDLSGSLTRAQQLWLPHLTDVLPVAMPPQILAKLLEACSQVIGSVRPQTAKMVNAVQPLFPDYAQTLNEVMGRIRLSPSLCPTRFSAADQEQQRQKLAALLPVDYGQATLEQQMVLSLLVAKEVLDLLTIALSPRQTQIERLWMTASGVVRLAVDYDPLAAQAGDWMSQTPLRARVQLPGGGMLALKTAQDTITTQRQTAGYLSVELSQWEMGACYLLTIGLDQPVTSSLKFAISCQP